MKTLRVAALLGGLVGLMGGALAQPKPLAPVQLLLVGDSTLASHNGYGDALCARFAPALRCLNLAKNGRSTLSYRAEGSWQAVLDQIAQSGNFTQTYVLIEFGHNDQPGKPGRSTDLATEFPANLQRYIADVKKLGAQPILATPLTRRNFKDGQLVPDLAQWGEATRRVAAQEGVPLVDLLAASSSAVQTMGSAQADTLAVEPAPPVTTPPGSTPESLQTEVVSNRKSAFDHTHVGPKGADFFAQIALPLLVHAVPDLAAYQSAERQKP